MSLETSIVLTNPMCLTYNPALKATRGLQVGHPMPKPRSCNEGLKAARGLGVTQSDSNYQTMKGTKKIQFLLGFWKCLVLIYIFFMIKLDAFETAQVAHAHHGPAHIASVFTYERTIQRAYGVHAGRPVPKAGGRKLSFLVEEPAVILNYHNGPLMNSGSHVPIHIIWYGEFSKAQKSIVCDFFGCFRASKHKMPSVKGWWNVTQGYKDDKGRPVAGLLNLGAQIHDPGCSRGLSLTENDLQSIVMNSFNSTDPESRLPMEANAIYFVLTAENVYVDDFCMNSCASHFATLPVDETNGQQLPFAWVGNSGLQCPGQCAWPFARAEFGPPGPILKAPNGDVGVDGMIINMAAMLAGSATNPFNNGFYQGDAGAPLEAATACSGIYGKGAYPGYPGDLKVDDATGASYNAHGFWNSTRKFLLPALWDPETLACTPP